MGAVVTSRPSILAFSGWSRSVVRGWFPSVYHLHCFDQKTHGPFGARCVHMMNKLPRLLHLTGAMVYDLYKIEAGYALHVFVPIMNFDCKKVFQ